MELKNLAVGIASAVIGLVVLVSLIAGVYSTLITGLTTLNATPGGDGTYNATTGVGLLPLRALIAPNGVIPLIIIAVMVVGIIVGLFAMIKKR